MFSFFQLPFQMPSFSFPSISLPASIQRRFIAFVLQRSLGHFVKPGQLDGEQVNAQLGSGFVQINDLELDDQAINQSLEGLPIRLKEGVIRSVAVTLPFQNILSAPLVVAAEGLEISVLLQRAPVSGSSSNSTPSNDPLASSVVSVAQEFIHDELETPSLRESLYLEKRRSQAPAQSSREIDVSTHIPGALDPFVSDILDPQMDEAIKKEEENIDDVEGVSMLAQVIEIVLARLSFTVSNIVLKIIHEGHTEAILEIKKVEYVVEGKGELMPEGIGAQTIVGTRSIRIDGIEISLKDLNADHQTSVDLFTGSSTNTLQLSDAVPSSHSMTVPELPPHVVEESPYQEEDLEEELDASMTQSMISLPPPPRSNDDDPSNSPSSTMFYSAASVRAHTPPPPTQLDSSPIISHSTHSTVPSTFAAEPLTSRIVQSTPIKLHPSVSSTYKVLSFGSEPVVLSLSPPEPSTTEPADPNSSRIPPSPLKFTMRLGIIALAISASQINSISAMISLIMPQPSSLNPGSSSIPAAKPQTKLGSSHFTAHLKGIQLFLFRDDLFPPALSIADIFAHPTSALVQAQHLRVQVEGVTFHLPAESTTGMGIRGAIQDVSAFFIHEHKSPMDQQTCWLASPLVIVDHQMISQYDPSRGLKETSVLPIVNWTDPTTHGNLIGRPKKSLWRSKATKATLSRTSPNKDNDSPDAVTFFSCIPQGEQLDVGIAPLHLFADASVIEWMLVLSQQVKIPSADLPEIRGDDHDHDRERPVQGGFKQQDTQDMRKVSPSTTPKARSSDLPRDERADIADIFLADTESKAKDRAEIKSLRFEMVRLELRVPSPSKYRQRSGSFALDLHELRVAFGSESIPQTNRQPGRVHWGPQEQELQIPILLEMAWGHTFAFYAGSLDTKAVPFLALGTLPVASGASTISMSGSRSISLRVQKGILPQQSTQRPRIPVSEAQFSTTAINISVPTVFVSLRKQTLDGLQLWADDLTQWADHALSELPSQDGTKTSTSQTTSRNQSALIGSRYFVERTASQVGGEDPVLSETVVKFCVDDASVQLWVKRGDGDDKPLHISASDVQTTLQLKPEGRDETVVMVTVLDATIHDTPLDRTLTLLELTSSRSLLAPATPMLVLRLDSVSLPGSKSKQSKIQSTASKFTFTAYPDFSWLTDLARFAQAPPGAFEQVIPSERTVLQVNAKDGSIDVRPPNHPGGLVLNLDDVSVSTELLSSSSDASINLEGRTLNVLLLDDLLAPSPESLKDKEIDRGYHHWLKRGYAPIFHASDFHLSFIRVENETQPRSSIEISDTTISLHFCADTIPTLAAIAGDLATLSPTTGPSPPAPTVSTIGGRGNKSKRDMGKSIFMDDNAFKQPPTIGPEPDMVEDDLPKNSEFIDASYGAAAGARPLTEEDLEDFDDDDDDDVDGRLTPTLGASTDRIVSNVGGETVRLLSVEGIQIVEGYFDHLPADIATAPSSYGDSQLSVRVRNSRVHLHLHSGYDWYRTRRLIEEETKAIRKRLEKIRQLLASGQTPDPSIEKTNSLLFNSVYLGLDADMESLDGQDIAEAIDENLAEEFETASHESWQSLPVTSLPQGGKIKTRRRKTRARSKVSEVEIQIQGLNADLDKYGDQADVASRVFTTIRDLKVLDHMKTSTWVNFLTAMRVDSRGNRRETDSDMVRLELKMVKPVKELPNEEARLRAKILPIRLHVDQDALDFLKRFFSFKDADGWQPPVPPTPSPEIFFQQVEIFPVELKLDYKPKRVDYKALKEGRTIELMNFFHFEDAAMTLRRITLTGLTGWARLGDTLNDLWTPDVKANQLADVISGIAPIRSLVNVGSGVADLLLLPIAQYKKDRRVFRGVQKGTRAFVQSAVAEGVKVGARLATGTQVILEHTEHVLGADVVPEGQFREGITAEAISSPILSSRRPGSTDGGLALEINEALGDEETGDGAVFSRYATQPEDVREGMKTAYKSLKKNVNAAAQTILAVPMEVYEQSGSGGPVRAVVRAVPIAVIKPMIGASEAVRETLLGLRNTLDPELKQENVDKYKAAN